MLLMRRGIGVIQGEGCAECLTLNAKEGMRREDEKRRRWRLQKNGAPSVAFFFFFFF
jgi:hypothetical protein